MTQEASQLEKIRGFRLLLPALKNYDSKASGTKISVRFALLKSNSIVKDIRNKPCADSCDIEGVASKEIGTLDLNFDRIIDMPDGWLNDSPELFNILVNYFDQAGT